MNTRPQLSPTQVNVTKSLLCDAVKDRETTNSVFVGRGERSLSTAFAVSLRVEERGWG